MDDLKKKFELSLYGVLTGDVLGGPFQFNDRKRTEHITSGNIIEQMDVFNDELENNHNRRIKDGTYSDDGALTLATMDGLCEVGHIPSKLDEYAPIVDCFIDWLLNGVYTQDGRAWDVGRTTWKAIFGYYNQKTEEFALTGPKDSRSSGNGSLMRFAPVPFLLYKEHGINALDSYENRQFVYNMSSITHGSWESRKFCLIYTALMLCVLDGVEKDVLLARTKELLDRSGAEYPVGSRIFAEGFSKLPSYDIESSGYIVHSLEAAIWSFMNTENFEDCIALAISLGEDTDSIGAVVGSFASVYYGKINDEWKEMIRKRDMVEEYLGRFTKTFLKD